MPIYQDGVKELLRIKQTHSLTGLVGVLGRFTSFSGIDYDFLRKIGCRPPEHKSGTEMVDDDKALFTALGYDGVESIDISDFEGAEHIVDMNYPLGKIDTVSRFDVLINNGSLEHIFHVPNCLDNITKMLKVGGHVIHMVPIHNWVDHGFYQISPGLLIDYYIANGFAVRDGKIIQYIYSEDQKSLQFRYLTIGGLSSYATPKYPFATLQGKFGPEMYSYSFVAQKIEASTTGIIPTQTFYQSDIEKKRNLERLNQAWLG